MPQIRLQEFLLNIDNNKIQKIWKVYYITLITLTAKPHYVVLLTDSTLLCTCMYIINQEMPCQHQYRILLQSDKAMGVFTDPVIEIGIEIRIEISLRLGLTFQS